MNKQNREAPGNAPSFPKGSIPPMPTGKVPVKQQK